MTIYIEDPVLSFSDSSYSPPTPSGTIYYFTLLSDNELEPGYPIWTDSVTKSWVDGEGPEWRESWPGYLSEIYTDSSYVYAAHSNGLDIINLLTEQRIAYITYTEGFTSVCGNSENVYLGTLTNGIYYIDKTTISGTIDNVVDMSSNITLLDTTYKPSSNRINGLYINSYDLAVVTNSGIDVIGVGAGQEYKSSTTVSSVYKTFVTSKKELYYITNNGTYTINKVAPCSCDWTTPDTSYVVGDSFLQEGLLLTDFFITENTSVVDGYNTLFVATSSGVYVYDEGESTLNVYLTTD